MALKIGELAKATGVEVETIRYYEKAGLLPAPARSPNGYRVYSAKHLESLSFIRHCRALDIPLVQIKQLLAFLSNPDADCGDINDLIDEQLARVQARLVSMQALAQQLESLRSQCGERHLVKDCGILQELVAAAQGEACACHRD